MAAAMPEVWQKKVIHANSKRIRRIGEISEVLYEYYVEKERVKHFSLDPSCIGIENKNYLSYATYLQGVSKKELQDTVEELIKEKTNERDHHQA